ncbi:hypothetical protein ABZP36_000807 [Zizania latifolia]
MGLLFVESLSGPKMFKCKFCKVDSASPDDIVSKEFRGRHGHAYLFDSVVGGWDGKENSWNVSNIAE